MNFIAITVVSQLSSAKRLTEGLLKKNLMAKMVGTTSAEPFPIAFIYNLTPTSYILTL
jgi:hypothetical protein